MKPLLKVETYTSGSLPHEQVITNNMLNSTKTWQERFDERFEEATIPMETDSGWATNSCSEEIKQFISDLRKKDEDELIKMLNRQAFPHIELIIQLIKDYYAK